MGLAEFVNTDGLSKGALMTAAAVGVGTLVVVFYLRKRKCAARVLPVKPKASAQPSKLTPAGFDVPDATSTLPAPPKSHYKCRGGTYAREKTQRFLVPDGKVSWAVPFPEYKPVSLTCQSVASQPVWADKDFKNDPKQTPKYNDVDGKVDRRSHNGHYEVISGLPRNPVGRTGICERGTLGRWGPNHAADPIVTRWFRGEDGKIVKDEETGKPVLEFVAILRSDSGEWAIPGGMVDPGEQLSVTLKREFSEEAMNSIEASDAEKQDIEDKIKDLFSQGETVYKGYVDDPRNTDNAWMETVAVNFHDEDGTSVGRFKLHAGDDATGVKWTTVDQDIKLYASHADFIKTTAQLHNAHW